MNVEVDRQTTSGLAPSFTPVIARARKRVEVQISVPANLTLAETERMYAVFSKYYNNHSKDIFLKDLFEKDHVFLLRDLQNKTIQGFSTLLRVDLKKYGIRATGFYSGDTVLEREYWGDRALAMAFISHLWREKMKNPFRPVYWFLISKGYKTYLLMTNNFTVHYPRLDQVTPIEMRKLMDLFYADRFGEKYNKAMGLVEFDSEACCLKEKVAEITQELIKNEKIRFFAQMNPHWQRGYELTCLAEMTLWLPFKFFLKKTFKHLR